jgi:predicted dehydrogenase
MNPKRKYRVVGINFDHFHMGDLLRFVCEHPQAEIAGICDDDPDRMIPTVRELGIPSDRVFQDYRACLEKTRPDLVILCPATADHAAWTEKIAAYRLPVLIEKPFAASLDEADRMVAAMDRAGQPLAINWPLRWFPCHATAKRLVDQALLGEVLEVHFYDGNRGPLYHGAHKIAKEPTLEEKAASWFYRKDRGGGSLLDYLGYGTTLGTWFQQGRVPIEVTAVTDETPGLEVDQHSITIARYPHGLSKFETRWGTFTDPWMHPPQPRCGFVIVGTEGTVASWDYADHLTVQTRARPEGYLEPTDPPAPPCRNPVEYMLHCLETATPITGPLSPEISRIGQQIVDTALASAQRKCTLLLLGSPTRS